MRLLLVEDEGPKFNKILACLCEAFPGVTVDAARSVRSALTKLDDSVYDVVILDMSLPTFDISEDEHGGRPQGFGGVEVMRDMTNYEIRTPVIVVTAYEYFSEDSEVGNVHGKEATLAELTDSLLEEFSDIFCELVKYDTFSDEWRDHLINTVQVLEGGF
jgi:CheY-like chemotaxis protein